MRTLRALLIAGLLFGTVVGCSTKSSDDIAFDRTTTTERQTDRTDRTTTSSDGSASSELDDLQTCASVSALTVTLGLGAAFLSDEQRAELQQELDDLEGKVPEEIRDDLRAIRDGAADADSLEELGAFLDSAEYETAIDNIEDYLDRVCDIPGVPD